MKLGIFGPFQKNIIPYLVTDSSSHSVNENPILDGSVPRMASEGVTGWLKSSAPTTVVLIALTSGGFNRGITPTIIKCILETTENAFTKACQDVNELSSFNFFAFLFGRLLDVW